ncbi:hypothetical protein [Streptomyces sp. x-19]|uniref:hypothetical protein n=1 Tax=Streptomyces sp. x-19 TaxID=2789280 RepID=UPI0039808904
MRQAADQAALRKSVKVVLTSLGRRNQGLVCRQLAVITELEETEQNPARLADLFQIDHLATRMRRYGENLLLADESADRATRYSDPAEPVQVDAGLGSGRRRPLDQRPGRRDVANHDGRPQRPAQ